MFSKILKTIHMKILRLFTIILILMNSAMLLADNYEMKLNVVEDKIFAGETFHVEIEITNSEDFVAFSLDIPLKPGELTQPFVYDDFIEGDRFDGHTYSAIVLDGNILRIFVFHPEETTAFTGNEGVVATIQLTAPEAPGDHLLEIVDGILSDADGNPLLPLNTVNTSVTLIGNEMTILDAAVIIGQDATIYIEIDNFQDFTAFQADIILPDDFEYVHDSAILSERAVVGDHQVFVSEYTNAGGENVLRLFATSPDNTLFTDKEGVVVQFNLTAGLNALVGDNPLHYEVAIISDAAGDNILTKQHEGVVTVISDNIITIMNAEGFTNETITMEIAVDNTLPFVGFEIEFVFEDGFVFDMESITLTDRADESHTPEVSVLPGVENGFKLFVFSPDNASFSGFGGTVAAFDVQLPNVPSLPDEPYIVLLEKGILADPDGMEIESNRVNGEVTVLALIELDLQDAIACTNIPVTIDLNLLNSQVLLAFETRVQVPDGFSYVPNSAVVNADRVEEHVVDAQFNNETGVLTVILFSNNPDANEIAFVDESSWIVKFDLYTPIVQESTVFDIELFGSLVASANIEGIVPIEGDAQITLHPETIVGFSFTDYGLVDTDDVLNYCGIDVINVTLSDIWSGIAPFDIVWTVNGDEGFANGVELNDLVFSGTLSAGTYEVQVISITDANGCGPNDLSPYRLTINIYDDITYTEPEDLTVYSCELLTQDAVDAAFNNWLDLALDDLAGGEAVTFSFTVDGEVPQLCEGGEVEVTWIITDSCGSFIETAMFILVAPDAISWDQPEDAVVNSCEFADQEALEMAFLTWVSDQIIALNIQGGCDPQVEVVWSEEYPQLCTGSTTVVEWIISDDMCDTLIEPFSASFILTAPQPITWTDLEDEIEHACNFTDQDDLETSFDAWVAAQAAALNIEGGCNPQIDVLWSGVYPQLCSNSATVVEWIISDDICYTHTEVITATFFITAPDMISWTDPVDADEHACGFEDQTALEAAFNEWVAVETAALDIQGGCDPQVTVVWSENYPQLCTSSTTLVEWVISDDICYTHNVIITATFHFTAPEVITYDEPQDIHLDGNDFIVQQDIVDAFDAWFYAQNAAVTSTINGGCEPVVTNNSAVVVLPGICEGGSAEVTWTITDLCETIELKASFNVSQPDEPLLVFAINGQPIGQNHIEYVFKGDEVVVSAHDALAGQYPFTISWTINGDADHDFAGTDVVVTEAGQVLFPLNDEDIPLGEYVIEITSLVDANGCVAENLDLYVATIIVEPIILTIDGSFTVFNKLVDGSQEATINEDNIILVGVNPDYPVSLVKVAEFVDAEVGNNKEVNLLASYLEGASADAYVLSFVDAPTTTANILPAVPPVIVYGDGTFVEPDPEFFEGTTKVYQVLNVQPGFIYSWEVTPEANVIVSETNNTVVIEWNETGTLTLKATVTGSDPADPGVLETTLDVSVIQIALRGTVKYNRNDGNHTPISGVKVKLIPVNGGASIERITGANGFYQFLTIPDGEYIVEVSTQIPWGGVNASDALAVQRRSVALYPPFYHPDNFDFAFRDKVGDVRARGLAPNAGDAFMIQRRAIQLITEFPAGDWAFTVMPDEGDISSEMFFTNVGESVATKTFNTSTDSRVMNILAMTYGDVNASYNLGTTPKNSEPVRGGSDIIMKKGDVIQVPVKIKSDATVGSMSIFIEYAHQLIEVSGMYTNVSDMFYHVTDESINVAWADMNGLILPDDNTLFMLELIAKQDVMWHDEPFYIDSRTEFTDTFGTFLDDAYILLDADVVTGIIDDIHTENMFSVMCHPNPVTDWLTVEYKLPENADVELMIVGPYGQLVSSVISEKQSTGRHAIQFDLGQHSLKSGMYFVRILAVGENYTFNETVRIVVIN